MFEKSFVLPIMDSIQNSVYYCCVYNWYRVLYAYSNGNQEVESIAALCLERTPSFHTWYFETIGKRTFGFLMEDGYVYFAIVDKGHGNLKVLCFLEHVKDEFKKISMKKPKGSVAGSSNVSLHEELVPVIRKLISSLENVSRVEGDQTSKMHPHYPSIQMCNLDAATSSTKAPLLDKPNKNEKKMKDRLPEAKDILESEDRGIPKERGIKVGIESSEPKQGGSSSSSLQKSLSRNRRQQLARGMWWRRVWIVLAIDVGICLILFGIWLGICKGFQCISS